ncbi:MAG: hypothetical protein ACE5GM_10095, partial [bacterium]
MDRCHYLFQLDSDHEIGLGHLRRCLVLACAEVGSNFNQSLEVAKGIVNLTHLLRKIRPTLQ